MQYQSPTNARSPGARPVSAFGVPQDATPVSSTPPTHTFMPWHGQIPSLQPSPQRHPDDIDDRPDVYEQEPTADAKQRKISSGRASNLLIITGVLLLALVSLTPVWDSVVLLDSPTYVYFQGRTIPTFTIVLCGTLIVLFFLTMMLVERCGRRDVGTTQSFMYMFTATITALGLGLLLFAQPLQLNTRLVYTDLMVNCQTSPLTEPLYSYYNVLLNLRTQPDCLNKTSVEQCQGFEEHNPYTGYLKDIELGYMCSGFCFTGINSTAKRVPKAVLMEQEAKDSMSLLQAGLIETVATHPDREKTMKSGRSRSQKRQTTHGTALLSTDQTLSRVAGEAPSWEELPKGVGDTVNNMVSTGWMDKYPPTLFTNANYKTSCEGAAARDLRFTAIETGNLMYLEGSLLLLTSVIIGFLKILAMCRTRGAEPQAEIVTSVDGNGQYTSYTAKKVVL